MGTSATISFMSEQEGLVSVYNHFDGYAEGMAEKLAAYRDCDSRGHAARFIRANEHAEIVGNNGFTPAGEYTYIINKRRGEVSVEAYRDRNQRAFFRGTLENFLELYLRDESAA